MKKTALSYGCALAALCTALPAFAQSTAPASGAPTAPPAAAPGQPDADQTPPEAQDIIVTGSARTQRRFDVSYAVNALSQNDVKRLAPTSIADLVGKLPGIQVEATGGEVSNVTRVRGIPTDDGYLQFQQDGLPLYQDITGPGFKGDTFNRYDLMTDRLELVRGGPAPIFASQAAAIANSVTVTGTDVTRGKIQFTAGTTDLYRLDAVQSGPLGGRTYYAIGGFIRTDGGQRYGGFPTDRGGQIRANIKHDFDNGSVKLTGLYLNDHNVFYLPIPLADPRNINVSLDPYLDYFHGTLNTPALRSNFLKYLDGSGTLVSRNRDLGEGRHTRLGNVSLQYDGDFSGWLVSAKGGYTSGRMLNNAFQSATPPVAGSTYAASRLAAATAAFPTTARLGYVIAGTAQIGAAAGTAANGTPYDPNADSGLVIQNTFRALDVDFYSGQGDLSVTRKIETGLGTHDFKVGAYGSAYGVEQLQTYQNYLVQLRSQPATLDLVAYNAAGSVVGLVTQNGVVSYTGASLVGGKVNATVWALYANDEWSITPKLRLDGGVRHERYTYQGYSNLTATANLGDATTLADDATLRFTGATQDNRKTFNITNWTAGLNYDASSRIGGYVRASHLEAPPAAVLTTMINQTYLITKANQYEVGLKASFGRSYLYLTGFYTKFKPFNSSFTPFDPVTGTALANVPFISDLDVKGVEADGALNIVPWFSLSGSVTYQNPEYKNLQSTSTSAVSPAQIEGKQVLREPKIFGNIRPSFNLDLGDVKLDIYGRYEFVGKRYVDFLNTTALPSYHQYSAGVTATYGTWQLQVVGDNLFNNKGLTEGNNRVDQLTGQGTREAIYGRPIYGRSGRIILSKSW